MLHDIGVTGVSNMAAIKRKYVCKILYLRLFKRDSNGYPHILRVRPYGGTSAESLQHLSVMEIRDGGDLPKVVREWYVSLLMHDGNEIPIAVVMFSGLSYTPKLQRKPETDWRVNSLGLEDGVR